MRVGGLLRLARVIEGLNCEVFQLGSDVLVEGFASDEGVDGLARRLDDVFVGGRQIWQAIGSVFTSDGSPAGNWFVREVGRDQRGKGEAVAESGNYATTAVWKLLEHDTTTHALRRGSDVELFVKWHM